MTSRFVKGVGVYKCLGCGRMTRATGHDCDGTITSNHCGVVGYCNHCFDQQSIENMIADGDSVDVDAHLLARLALIEECKILGGKPSEHIWWNQEEK